MSPLTPILVTGAAGRAGGIGRTLTELLLKQGRAVRAMVRTEDQRLTLRFGSHHAHFKSDDHEGLFEACFNLVAGVLDERIVSVMLFHGGHPYVSDFCHLEDLPAVEAASRPPPKPGWVRRLLSIGPRNETGNAGNTTTWRSYGPVHYALGPPPPGACIMEIHSWLGSHDRRTALS